MLQFARIDRADSEGGCETVCLALEVIENHAYDRSRFLRGATVDVARIERELPAEAQAPALSAGATPLRWLGPGRTHFELLDKPIVFDDAQDEAFRHPAPLVVTGSAGSGKTAVTLARLREAEGRVFYVTLSAYLAQSARAARRARLQERQAGGRLPQLSRAAGDAARAAGLRGDAAGVRRLERAPS